MFARLIAFLLLISVGYTLVVFIAPSFADKYGNIGLNTKIRSIKEGSLSLGSGELSPSSLFDQVTNNTKAVVDETKQAYDNIQSTVTTKTEQVKQAADSVQKAVDAVGTATKDIQKLTTLTGTSITGSITK